MKICQNKICFFIIFFTFCGLMHSCTRTDRKIENHFNEKLFEVAALKINDQSIENATKYVDSLYKTFPYVSIKDKYQYLKFKAYTYSHTNLTPRNYPLAHVYVDSMISLLEKNDLTNSLVIDYSNAFNQKTYYYIEENELEKALDLALMDKAIVEKTSDFCLRAKNASAIGQIYFRTNRYNVAAKSFLEENKYLEKCTNEENPFYAKQLVLGNIGRCYMRENDTKNAQIFYKRRLEYITTNKQLINNNIEFYYIVLENAQNAISRIYVKEKRYDEALVFARLADESAKKIKYPEANYYFKYANYAEIFIEQNRLIEAREAIANAEKYLSFIKPADKIGYFRIKRRFSEIMKNKIDYFKYDALCYQIKDSLNIANEVVRNKNPQIEYEKLKKDLNAAAQKKEEQYKQIYIFLLATLFILVTYFLLLTRKNLKRKNRLFDEIQKLNQNLSENENNLKQANLDLEISKEKQKSEALMLQQIKLQLDYKDRLITQKKKISNELHDGISGTLAALKYYLTDQKRQNKNSKTSDIIADIEGEINNIYENLRKFLSNLQSDSNSVDLDIFKFLNQISSKFNKGNLLKIVLNYNEAKIKAELSTFALNQLSYVINESVSNSIRHSNGNILEVIININNGHCYFCVSDNGTGFDLKNIQRGLGLENMKARINELGGKIDLNSNTDGTKIIGSFKIL